ncbi:helix-turn-helix domain-containing protein [Shinella sp. CPCC 101442]|uniref:helix-turn-helix domain-containing protein n=1 Tax=Shinella sp. CPCC 101442 TaxID=2932265 RepID=UPI0035B5675B
MMSRPAATLWRRSKAMGEVSADLLTPDQAAQLLTISTKTLREHVRAGEIAFIPTGRGEKRVRMGFDRKDILDFIESRRKRACPSTSTQKAPSTKLSSNSMVILFEDLQRPGTRRKPKP